MPAKVANVAWKCPQCGKRKWLKPGVARVRTVCSRICLYARNRVEKPVREKPARRMARYGTKACPICQKNFEAKNVNQLYCSQPCSLRNAQVKRRKEPSGSRACEACGTGFTPKNNSNAGRFCSRICNFNGQRGTLSPQWKGGRTVSNSGYVLIRTPDHPYAHKGVGYVPEHRLVMEQVLGRYLEPRETVHHVNGVRSDNRPENLQLRQGKHGPGAAYRCQDCGSHRVEAVKLLEP